MRGMRSSWGESARQLCCQQGQSTRSRKCGVCDARSCGQSSAPGTTGPRAVRCAISGKASRSTQMSSHQDRRNMAQFRASCPRAPPLPVREASPSSVFLVRADDIARSWSVAQFRVSCPCAPPAKALPARVARPRFGFPVQLSPVSGIPARAFRRRKHCQFVERNPVSHVLSARSPAKTLPVLSGFLSARAGKNIASLWRVAQFRVSCPRSASENIASSWSVVTGFLPALRQREYFIASSWSVAQFRVSGPYAPSAAALLWSVAQFRISCPRALLAKPLPVRGGYASFGLPVRVLRQRNIASSCSVAPVLGFLFVYPPARH